MNEIKFKGGKKRIEAYEKLKIFLSNPGMFCVVVVGSRGSGKRFAVKKAFEHIQNMYSLDELERLCLKKLNFHSSHEIPFEKTKLDKLFQSYLNETLVIEDFDELIEEQKLLLLEALSTVDGKFGVQKKVNIRILFSSTKSINDLRNEDKNVSQLLWDRISQLIIELPSFQEEGSNILNDFENTWIKMSFEKISGYEKLATIPKLDGLRYFLESKHTEFFGGFRDLDKIACLYFNYRIFHYGKKRNIDSKIEKLVFDDVKQDFIGKTQMTDKDPVINSLFDFEAVKHSEDEKKHPTLDDFNLAFRVHFRKWLIDKHSTLSRAAEKLNCSIHTLKNYKEGRAKKSKREGKIEQK
jgi:hypothetical protein